MKFLRYILIFSLIVALGLAFSVTARAESVAIQANPNAVCEKTAITTGYSLFDELNAGIAFGAHVTHKVTDQAAIHWLVIALGGGEVRAQAITMILVWENPKGGMDLIEGFDKNECHMGGKLVPHGAIPSLLYRAGIPTSA